MLHQPHAWVQGCSWKYCTDVSEVLAVQALESSHVLIKVDHTIFLMQVGDQSEFVTTCAGVLRGSQAGLAGAAPSLSQRLGEALQPTAFGYLCDKLAASFCPRCAQMLDEPRAKMFTGWDDVGLGCINHQV